MSIRTAIITMMIVCGIMGIITGILIDANIQMRSQLINNNGYAHISDDPLWNCAGNWYNAYIQLANNPNQPAGDTSLWNYYCPNIPMPAN